MPANLSIFISILSLLIAVAGWYYTFNSRAAERLSAVEDSSLNQRRQRLRRFGGCAMMGLAILFFAGFFSIDFRLQPRVFVAIWLGVFFLLAAIVWLALIDLRLTMRLRKSRPFERGK